MIGIRSGLGECGVSEIWIFGIGIFEFGTFQPPCWALACFNFLQVYPSTVPESLNPSVPYPPKSCFLDPISRNLIVQTVHVILLSGCHLLLRSFVPCELRLIFILLLILKGAIVVKKLKS